MNKTVMPALIIVSIIAGWLIGGHRQISFSTEKSVALQSLPNKLKIELQSRRPNYDPYGQSFHETDQKTLLSCQETLGKNVAVILSMGQSNSTNETELTSRYTVRNNVFNLRSL